MNIITNLKRFNQEYLKAEKWYPFYIILVINLYLLITYPKKVFFWDAGQYMTLAKTFIVDGHFSLLNYASEVRGYFFPLMLQIPLQFSNLTGLNEVFGFRILSAIAIGICLAILFPKILEELFNFHAKPLQILIFAALVTFFWYGNYAYPLSDFPSLAFFLTGLTLCLQVFKSKNALWFKGLMIFLAGICLASSTSIRITYLIPFFIILLIFLVRLAFTKFKISNKLVIAIFLIVGSIIVFIPQALSNRIHYKVNTPFQVETIFMAQLYGGLDVQRVDCGTSIPNTPSLVITESQGTAILKKYDIGAGGLTLARYFDIVYHQPFDIATLYVRHLFDGLDIVYPTTYVRDIYANTIIYRLVNYTLWFLAISLLWRRGIRIKQDGETLIVCFIVILPALLSIPSRIEVRYFLPVYILMYGCISFWLFSKREHWKQFLTWRSAIAYICFLAACFTFSSYLFSEIGILLQN